MIHGTVYAPSVVLQQPPVVAASKMIEVLGMPGDNGANQSGASLSVLIHLTNDTLDFSHVRLIVGNIPVQTSIFEVDKILGRWRLEALAPPRDQHQHHGDLSSPVSQVSVRVQALDHSDHVMDEVVCGSFIYSPTISHTSLPYHGNPSLNAASAETLPTHSMPSSSPLESFVDPSIITRRRAYTLPSAPVSRFPKSSHRPSQTASRRLKPQSMMRAKYAKNVNSATQQMYSGTPSVEIVTPLQSMCADWTSQELAAGRRLVRFSKVQHGYRFLISFVAMSQDEFADLPEGSAEHEGVVSCIYRKETGLYYITSVDLIYLLERLAEDDFPVEEKNRIRRNLEGLRPSTISKHKADSEAFFHQIMEFPDPKPRNIEKDLKVFEWSLLGQALQKILSKYSLFTQTPINVEENSSSASSQSPLGWEEPINVPPPNPNFLIPCKREHTATPPVLLSPLLSASADRVDHDLDSDSSSASGHGWEPILGDIHVGTYGDYSDPGAASHAFLFEPVIPTDEAHFSYDINDFGGSFIDMQGPLDINGLVNVGTTGLGDIDIRSI